MTSCLGGCSAIAHRHSLSWRKETQPILLLCIYANTSLAVSVPRMRSLAPIPKGMACFQDERKNFFHPLDNHVLQL
ncbi:MULTISPECIES: hypothetical protein [Cyanophyceae]|uniref:hypothetical protein n=1 Tax=Cyanophyceae TaxID=3028117 RepID=UPI001685E5AE|nr:hypothetical protein [Trichocoleus sp. FACHB-40]MBD2005596.1 hypothetical protein [Trichocoleus sp. FACHB-40]